MWLMMTDHISVEQLAVMLPLVQRHVVPREGCRNLANTHHQATSDEDKAKVEMTLPP
jgi:hypothetical protein